jgi:uncharacterized membrane protein YhaH (DUF805 family)
MSKLDHPWSLWGRSYDEFFASRSRVSRLQFWGLVLLGISLIAIGLGLLTMIVSKLNLKSLDGLGIIVLIIAVVIDGGIVTFGVLHIRRALAGRH